MIKTHSIFSLFGGKSALSKWQLRGQRQPTSRFCMTSELHVAFTILNDWKKNIESRTRFNDTWKFYSMSGSVSVKRVSGTQHRLHSVPTTVH